MNGTFLLLGSNIGDRLGNLKKAKTLLINKQIRVMQESSVYETEPWGIKEQDWFLNIVFQVGFDESAERLLTTCLEVEKEMGRERNGKWGPRLIDIDLLYFGQEIIKTDHLTVPHPGIPTRKFTLLPMVELAGSMIDPASQKSQIELLMECVDPLEVRKTKLALVDAS